jgi:hypothetical protein
LDGANSTAASRFGFADEVEAGTVYNAPDGAAPRLVTYAPSGQMDGIICTTEEA